MMRVAIKGAEAMRPKVATKKNTDISRMEFREKQKENETAKEVFFLAMKKDCSKSAEDE